MINSGKIEPWLLVLSLMIPIHVDSFELNIMYFLLIAPILLIGGKGKIKKNDFNLIFLLFIIIIIGIISAVFHKPVPYDFLKDILYFLKPILLIVTGYFIAKRIKNWKIIFKTLIYLGVAYAFYHIVHTVLFTDIRNASTSDFRRINGLANMIEIFSIMLIVIGIRYKKMNLIPDKATKYLFLFLLLVSFVFYFSRTMLVGVVIFIVASLGYFKLNKRGFKLILYMGFSIVALYVYLYSIDIKRDSTGFESFLYKVKLAPEEIFSPKLDLNNHKALWDHWRAYEAYCAIDNLNQNPFNYFLGKGFGALVDLKFISPLGEKGMRYIPILHNGYIFILFKTGIVGLSLYMLFLFYLYSQLYTNSVVSQENQVFRNIVAGFSIYLLFSTLIITGLYNLEEVTPLVLGVFLYLKTQSTYSIKNIDENSNTRNKRNP